VQADTASVRDDPVPGHRSPRVIRTAILADMLEEQWPSMDLVASALMRELPRLPDGCVVPRLVRPRLVPVLGRFRRDNGAYPTADRVFNRFWMYPWRMRSLVTGCDVFHIVDHSYAHLALSLPPRRVITTCHDIDTFRGFAAPGRIDTGLPRFLVSKLSAGLRASALVVCPSQSTAEEIVRAGLAVSGRVVVVPNGVDPHVADASSDREAARLLHAARPTIDLLHVGSTIDRKRVDLLLEAVALAAASVPEVRLIRVGGPFTPTQEERVAELGLADRILVLPFLDRATLYAVYRRATLLLVTSDREGFGLPVVEALSAALPVVARDLPVFREVAGDTATFVDSSDPAVWARTIGRLVAEARGDPEGLLARREAGRRRAAQFSWKRYAEDMATLYAKTVGALPTR
jgi:glycosyltransferase involved in cell wall biosynthesis